MHLRRCSAILILVILSFIIRTAIAEELAGSVSGELGPGTYEVTGNLNLLYGTSLIIHPGTVFTFMGDYDFDVYGYLYAVGTETDSILFRQGTGDTWNGIDFNIIAADSSILEYCEISGSNGVAIYLNNVSPTISHCLLINNVTGTG